MDKSYTDFTLEEFITDDYFIQWAKYPTKESDAYWQSFIEAEPTKASIVSQAQLVVQQLAMVAKQDAPFEEIPVVWAGIEDDLTIPNQAITPFSPIPWTRWVAAASVILLLGLGYWWMMPPSVLHTGEYAQLVSTTKKPLKEVINKSATNLVITMPDGSKAILKPKSRLSYTQSFSGVIREVYLSGEAFFDVKKDPSKPFLVYSNGLITKVLGTSFWIKAYDQDKQVTVLVKTGRVSVFAQKTSQTPDPEMEGVVLMPNQKVVFGKENERLTRTLIEKPTLIVSSRELQQFSFNNAPVTQIFAALEKAYGVDIVFDEEVIANCFLTTSLANETLFERLDIICEGIEASYKVVDAQVIISSKGCN